MVALTPHHFEGSSLRSLTLDGEPWFIAADAAKMLAYEHTPHLNRLLDDDEKGVHSVDTLGGEQNLSIISEAGLYRAILQRRATKALGPEIRARIERFQRWVFHEVLPSIRRTGCYVLPGADQPIREEPVSVRRGLVSEARQVFGVRAAGSLWFALGLPVVPEMRDGTAQGSLGFTYTAEPRDKPS